MVAQVDDMDHRPSWAERPCHCSERFHGVGEVLKHGAGENGVEGFGIFGEELLGGAACVAMKARRSRACCGENGSHSQIAGGYRADLLVASGIGVWGEAVHEMDLRRPVGQQMPRNHVVVAWADFGYPAVKVTPPCKRAVVVPNLSAVIGYGFGIEIPVGAAGCAYIAARQPSAFEPIVRYVGQADERHAPTHQPSRHVAGARNCYAAASKPIYVFWTH